MKIFEKEELEAVELNLNNTMLAIDNFAYWLENRDSESIEFRKCMLMMDTVSESITNIKKTLRIK